MTQYEEESSARDILKCGHMFHSECLETWLKVKQKCPLCNQDLRRHSLDPSRFRRARQQEQDIDQFLEDMVEEDYEQEDEIREQEERLQEQLRLDIGRIGIIQRNLLNNFQDRRNLNHEFHQNMQQFQQNMQEFQRNMVEQRNLQDNDEEYGLHNRRNQRRQNNNQHEGREGFEVELQPLRGSPEDNTRQRGLQMNDFDGDLNPFRSELGRLTDEFRNTGQGGDHIRRFHDMMTSMQSQLDVLNERIIRLTGEVDSRELLIANLRGRPEEREQIEILTQEIESRRIEIQQIFDDQSQEDETDDQTEIF